MIIDNATLTFEDSQDVALNAEYIILVNGGRLQVGTESEPFQHRGVINIHGHLRSIELPICKNISMVFLPIFISFLRNSISKMVQKYWLFVKVL